MSKRNFNGNENLQGGRKLKLKNDELEEMENEEVVEEVQEENENANSTFDNGGTSSYDTNFGAGDYFDGGSIEVDTAGENERYVKGTPYLTNIQFSIPKRDVVSYIINNLPVPARDVRFMQLSVVEFTRFLQVQDKGLRGAAMTDNDIVSLKKLYYPSTKEMGNQILNGVFSIKIQNNQIFANDNPTDIFEYSAASAPEVIFNNPSMKKFTLEGYRQIYSMNLKEKEVTYYIPAVLPILGLLGLNIVDTLENYYVSVGEIDDMVTIQIRIPNPILNDVNKVF